MQSAQDQQTSNQKWTRRKTNRHKTGNRLSSYLRREPDLDAPGAAVAIQTLIHRAKRSSLRAKEPSTWRKTSLELWPDPSRA